MQITQITFEPAVLEMTIGSTGKRARFEPKTVQMDLAALPKESIEFALAYGLKQYIADGAAGSEDQAGFNLGVDQRVRKLLEADFARTKGEATNRPDTAEVRAKKLAAQAIRTKLQANGAKADAKAINEAAGKMVAADPKWLAAAKKQLADEAKLREQEAEADGMDDIMADLLGLKASEEGSDEEETETETED